MFSSTTITAFLAASASLVSGAAVARRGSGESGSASVTPHDKYSSSIGVLGCKIDTNRVAYWPGSVSCDQICVKVSNEGRSRTLLKIDSSAGAHDISYDAWNYLAFGKSATEDPQMGGGVAMDYEFVDASECSDLLDDGKLPLMAANSMNFLASCLAEPNSFVAKHHALYNIQDAACTWGKDETCTLDLATSNQPDCPSGLGNQSKLDLKVMDIEYGTGKEVQAL